VRFIVWLLALAITGGLVWVGASLTQGATSRRAPVRIAAPGVPEAERARARRDPTPWARWSVTESLSAHYVLIVHVETRHFDEARAIARELTEPVKARYAEVLIYFHRPGRPDPLAPRRVQWTRESGYVEVRYE
jgi:hypothetical protein